ncbi:MAG: hypothetical protein ABII82_20785, partial [Verrucomicrobiota bacterium]
MAYPVAAGTVDVAASTVGWVPQHYSRKLLRNFRQRCVARRICNTDHQSEIRAKGNTVIMRRPPIVTISDHTDGQTLVPQQLSASPVTMVIDKGKTYFFVVPTVAAAQSDLSIRGMGIEDAGKGLQEAVDTDILQNAYSDASAYNQGASAG